MQMSNSTARILDTTPPISIDPPLGERYVLTSTPLSLRRAHQL
jgi:hypothetical protein